MRNVFVLAVLLSLLGSEASATPRYGGVVDLGPVAPMSDMDVNNRRAVVHNLFTENGFVILVSTPQTTGNLGPGRGMAISQSGQIVGEKQSTAVRSTIRGFEDIGEGPNSIATAVSGNGKHIVGWGSTHGSAEMFRVTYGGALPVVVTERFGNGIARGVNNRGTVVGSTADGKAFVYESGECTTFGVEYATAHAISNTGRVALTLDKRAAVANLKRGTVTLLEQGKAFESSAYDVNDPGLAVGMVIPIDTGQHAALWYRGRMINLNRYVAANSGWFLVEAKAINRRGDIVGWGWKDGEPHAFLLPARTTR